MNANRRTASAGATTWCASANSCASRKRCSGSSSFPILLAAGLGLAFRNRPAEVLQDRRRHAANWRQSLRQEKLLDVQQLPAPRRRSRLCAPAKWRCWPSPGPDGTVVYRYDDTNPEGRTARMLADRAIQRAAGRADPVPSSDQLMREPGSRYIDFLIPGLLGMNLMGSAIWGMGFAIVDARRKKLMKRLVATPMPRHYYLLSFLLSRLVLLVVEVRRAAGLRRVGVRRARARLACRRWRCCACWLRSRSARWDC